MRKVTVGMIVALGLGFGSAGADEIGNPLKNGPTWDALAYDVIGDAVPEDGAAVLEFDAPYRAHDAALVPIHIRQRDENGPRITNLTLVVDENPAPVVASFTFGPDMGALDLETRVRVDQYSNVRAIAETEDGRTWMTGRFVKASGGCSAPALKSMEDAIARAGQMRLKLFEPAAVSLPANSSRRQAQVMIRHPNYSGMQRNQITQLFIPAFFIHELEVYQGDSLLFRLEGGISISEDPVFRFAYTPNGAGSFRVRAVDTEGAVFERTFAADGQAS